jgi:hypothetical protein
MTENELEDIRTGLTERQIKLLGSYVRTTLFTRPSDADEKDYAALLDQKLIEPVGGAAEQTADMYRPTNARGRAWFDWYYEQAKS